MQPKIIDVALILFIFAATLATHGADATTAHFTVPSQSEATRTLDLEQDDRVAVGFTVVGESTNELNFYITDPYGNTILRYDEVGQKSFSFQASTPGIYVLHFDNSHSLEKKTVMLNYDIQHYILGIPQTLFFVLVIAVVSVVGIAFFVLLGKSSY